MIWNQLTVEGFFEGHPHILPKIAPIPRELVKMIGPGGIRQPIAATYPVDRVKEAVVVAISQAHLATRSVALKDQNEFASGVAKNPRSQRSTETDRAEYDDAVTAP